MKIRYGIPEIIEYFQSMRKALIDGTISKNEAILYKKVLKTAKLLESNPKHPSLNTHEIQELSSKMGFKIFEAYIENRKPRAGRLFWAYGPDKRDITILGIEPHPEDNKRGAYKRIKLSALPPVW